MTRPDRDYDEVLSRVLHSMLDPIEPAGDGLAKIRQRIAEPWLKRKLSLLRAELAALGWLIVVRCEPFLTQARSGFATFGASSLRWISAVFGFSSRGSSGRRRDERWREHAQPQGWLGTTMVWLRPTLAVGAAVIIVVAGVFALMKAQGAFISPTSSHTSRQDHHGHHHAAKTGVAGPHTRRVSAPSRRATSKPSARKSPGKSAGKAVAASSPACSPTPKPSASPSPSPSPTTTSPTPSPTTTSPTPSPTTSTAIPPAGTTAPTTPACSSQAT